MRGGVISGPKPRYFLKGFDTWVRFLFSFSTLKCPGGAAGKQEFTEAYVVNGNNPLFRLYLRVILFQRATGVRLLKQTAQAVL